MIPHNVYSRSLPAGGVIVFIWDYIANNQAKYLALLWQHLWLTLSAMAVSFAAGVSLGVLCYRNKTFNTWATTLAGALRVLPSLVIMLLLMPIMGTGTLPAVTALAILGLPPVVINTALGLLSTDPSVVEAAEACGMDERRIFLSIRLPLALPLIITGLRIAGLSVSAGAILAAYIGAGGLGELVLSGLSQYRSDMLLAGALATMAISLSIEGGFQLLYIASIRYRRTNL